VETSYEERLERRRRRGVRLRRLVAIVAFLAAAAGVVLVAAWSLREEPPPTVLTARQVMPATDPLAYEDSQAEDLQDAAILGLSQPLYAKSPGGVFTAARRTEAFRDQIEDAVEGSGFDADLVEAIVFLESGGRPEVIVGNDPENASGLTQILAETAQSFLGMEVDLERSRALTVRIIGAERRGQAARARALREQRRAIDARFDPEQALAGTVRYLTQARERLGTDELAVVSYHMGVGNLSNVIYAFTGAPAGEYVPDLVAEQELTWARLFFDTSPESHSLAHDLLSELGDDSPTYYWRVLAAREIMRLYREDRDRLQELDLLHRSKSSHEEVLHPSAETERFADADALREAWDAGELHELPDDPERLGFRIDASMGELARQLGQQPALYRGLREEALALLVYMAGRVKDSSGATQPLFVTSTLRDEEYQELLRGRNREATDGYSLHTTGYAFDIRRQYESGKQAQAFQFLLDDLTARGLIAWIREPGAIHITVAKEAEELVDAMLERVPAPAEETDSG
jgi:hypothetical protein